MSSRPPLQPRAASADDAADLAFGIDDILQLVNDEEDVDVSTLGFNPDEIDLAQLTALLFPPSDAPQSRLGPPRRVSQRKKKKKKKSKSKSPPKPRLNLRKQMRA